MKLCDVFCGMSEVVLISLDEDCCVISKGFAALFALCIWLELTRTYIPIRRMSPKRLHSRTSHALSVNRNCMGFFASGQKLPLDR